MVSGELEEREGIVGEEEGKRMEKIGEVRGKEKAAGEEDED